MMGFNIAFKMLTCQNVTKMLPGYSENAEYQSKIGYFVYDFISILIWGQAEICFTNKTFALCCV